MTKKRVWNWVFAMHANFVTTRKFEIFSRTAPFLILFENLDQLNYLPPPPGRAWGDV